MSTVEQSIEVAVPVTTAYNQWTQFTTFPQFMEGVERIDQTTDTMTHWVTSIGGVEREFDAKVMLQLDFEPDGIVETVGDKLGVVSHRIKGDLERFKEFIENRGGETGAWRGQVREE